MRPALNAPALHICHEFLLYNGCRTAGKNPFRLLYVQHQFVRAFARGGQKPLYRQKRTQRGVRQQQSDVSQGYSGKNHFDPARMAGFLDFRFVTQDHFDRRQARRGIP